MEDEAVCERCGSPARCHVIDMAEIEPELGTDGVLYSKKVDDVHHDFCWKHTRMPRTRKWIAPADWTPPAGWNPNADAATKPRTKP